MSIKNLGPNKWLVRTRARVSSGIPERKRTVIGTRADAQKVDLQLRQELLTEKPGSLTISTFHDALTFFRENTTAKLCRIDTLLNRLDREMGHVKLIDLSERFSAYWTFLRTDRVKRTGELLSNATCNRLLVYSKTALSFCLKRGLISTNPLKGFSKLDEEERERVLNDDERIRLINVLEKNKSYLLMPVLFSLKNPIRKSDLVALGKENLDRFRPWVHFRAAKTRRRKQRETCLPFLDDRLLEHFDSLPAECPFLFPRAFEAGEWQPLGDFKKHWHAMLREARIQDFHWHDLKHCAITWMLDAGYTDRDLKNLAIQYSTKMIDRYYKHDANKVLSKWKTEQGSDKKLQKAVN